MPPCYNATCTGRCWLQSYVLCASFGGIQAWGCTELQFLEGWLCSASPLLGGPGWFPQNTLALLHGNGHRPSCGAFHFHPFLQGRRWEAEFHKWGMRDALDVVSVLFITIADYVASLVVPCRLVSDIQLGTKTMYVMSVFSQIRAMRGELGGVSKCLGCQSRYQPAGFCCLP